MENIEIAKNTTEKTNCIGFALFGVGAIDSERYIGRTENDPEAKIVDQYLSEMKRVENVELGDLVVFRNDRGTKMVQHMGIVVDFNPGPVICHRPCLYGEIKLQRNFGLLIADYQELVECMYKANIAVEFYRP